MRIICLVLLFAFSINSHAIISRRHLDTIKRAKGGDSPLAGSNDTSHQSDEAVYQGQGAAAAEPRLSKATRKPRAADKHAAFDGGQSPTYAATRPSPVAPKPAISRRKSRDEIGQDFYTVQLLGSRDRFGLELFLRDAGYQDKAMVVKEFKDGDDWFVALYGHYKNKNEAKRAIVKLPRSLKGHHPWVRQRSSIRLTEAAGDSIPTHLANPHAGNHFKPMLEAPKEFADATTPAKKPKANLSFGAKLADEVRSMMSEHHEGVQVAENHFDAHSQSELTLESLTADTPPEKVDAKRAEDLKLKDDEGLIEISATS